MFMLHLITRWLSMPLLRSFSPVSDEFSKSGLSCPMSCLTLVNAAPNGSGLHGTPPHWGCWRIQITHSYISSIYCSGLQTFHQRQQRLEFSAPKCPSRTTLKATLYCQQKLLTNSE